MILERTISITSVFISVAFGYKHAQYNALHLFLQINVHVKHLTILMTTYCFLFPILF